MASALKRERHSGYGGTVLLMQILDLENVLSRHEYIVVALVP